jgi:hypothetical protein
MAITLDLPAETVRLLEEKAARAGQTLENYHQELAKRDVRAANGSSPVDSKAVPSPLPTEEWVARWYTWAERQLPRAVVLDDSRESIYAGRGE